MADDATEGKTPQEWVCTGHVILSDNKLGISFRKIEEQGQLGEEMYFDLKNFRHLRAGQVYKVLAGGTKVVVTSFEWQRTYEDADMVLQWQTRSRVADTEDRLRREERKAGQVNHLRGTLEPLRLLHSQTDYVGRVILEVMVLQELRRRSAGDFKR
jgi:hypothetical protein